MKIITILGLSTLSFAVSANSILGSLNDHQNSLEKVNNNPSLDSKSGVKSTATTSSVTGGRCEENDQTSLPLVYVTSLLQEKNAGLDVNFDPGTGTLSISAPDMISNCSSMIEWRLKTGEVSGNNTYSVEAKLKTGNDCSGPVCKYKVAIVDKGSFIEHKEMVFEPTLKGFEECLQRSGVIKNGKVDKGSIYSAPLSEKFKGIEETGKLLFVSHGPSSALVKSKYGKFEEVDKCDHYEQIHPQVKELLSLADEERQRLDAEAAKLKDCTINEYYKLSDFLEKYEGYASELGEIRDRLIIEAAKKSAKAIGEGKYSDEDLKVIADFEKYVVTPKIELAKVLYQEMTNLEGDARKAKMAELKTVLAEIAALNKAPYFQTSHTKKLIADAKFDEAEKLNTIKLTLDNYRNLGAKVDNVVITPEIAMMRVAQNKERFSIDLAKERENHEIRTGQTSGQAAYYANLTKRLRNNVKVRTENFTQEIQAEFARIQQGGYCYAYFRNTQKCIQDSMDRIKELQAILQHYNKLDVERANEYEAKAKEYEKLEAEGRRFIAAQNGEEIPVEVSKTDTEVEDTTIPSRRDRDENQGQNGIYNFNYPGVPQNMVHPSMFTGQPNFQMQQPWGNQFAQQTFMGSHAYGYAPQFGAGLGYSFNWGNQPNMNYGHQGWNQSQQSGYWGNPQAAYNNFSMYGYR